MPTRDRHQSAHDDAPKSAPKRDRHQSAHHGGQDKNSKPRHQGNIKIVIDPDRMAAYKVLLKIDKSKAYSNIELNAILHDERVFNPAFVRELVYGVIKNKRYLDYFIDELARDGIEGVRREIVILLRMGLYQIIFMDSVPAHSAVDETVKITKLLFPGRDGFVNGMLRSFIRQHEVDYSKPEDEAAESSVSAKDRCTGRPIPIPDIYDPIRRMSVMYSCDEGLVKLLAEQYGEDGAEEILKVSDETPPLFIRVNTIKTSPDVLDELLKAQGFGAEIYKTDNLVVSGKGILETKEFRDGLFFVQDASSSEAIKQLFVQDASSSDTIEDHDQKTGKESDPKAEKVLIDVCAAPGGKTFAAAMLMGNRGTIHAMDLHGNKLRALEKQAKRLGIETIDTREHDAKAADPEYAGAADKVLCDVPCSGLGVLRRKPEIKDRPLVNDGRDLAGIQYRILEASAEYVKPGGELMYSTCTINKIENEEVTDRFLREHGDFTRRCSRLTMPCSGGPDGFYYCIMQRDK